MTLRTMLLALFASIVSGCEKPSQSTTATPEPVATAFEITDPAVEELTLQAWSTTGELLGTSLTSAQSLNTAIAAMLSNPSKETLNAARNAWLDSHRAFQTVAIPLTLAETNPGLFGRLANLQFAVDAHPIQPGFIDYFAVYTHSGIVNDIAMPLTAEALRQQHGLTDTSDVSLGYHAIEYLLWGENGERPIADYQATEEINQAQRTAGLRVIDLPNNRRRTLIQLLANLLEDDLLALQQQWNNLAPYYRSITATGRVQLWRSAAHSWVITTIKQFDKYATHSNNPPEGDEPAPWPSPFAKGEQNPNAQALAAQLSTLDAILLNTESGLGRWSLPSEQRESLTTQINSLQTQIAALEGTWPGTLTDTIDEPLGALLEALSDETWQSVGSDALGTEPNSAE